MKTMKDLLEFGIINVDKPSGMTSFQVDDYIRERLGVKRTGHLGTLDPGVTGVLPITLNRACKLSKYLMKKDKEYVGVMRMHKEIDEKKIKEMMKEFIGEVRQMPPVRSAVKRKERTREIKRFEFLEREGKDVLFFTEVEAGTYIRTLVNDLGKKIGGAHMLELRRIRAGILSEKDSVNLYDFSKCVDDYKKGHDDSLRKIIIDAEDLIKKSMQIIYIKEDNLSKILNGRPIYEEDVINFEDKSKVEKGEFVGVFCHERFVEIALINDDKKGMIARGDFVFN